MGETSNGYYVLSKNENAKQPFHWVLKAPNHEVILKSENYTSKDGALNGIESVRVNSLLDERYQKLTSSNDKPYFNLIASNGQVIGSSQLYASESSRDSGIDAVKKYGENAALKEEI